jgi:glycosyltransferase involved in cell wall biosynthesis
MNKKVSFIVTVYNTKENLISRCLESIIYQSYENIECIVVDDGSCENIANFLDKFGEKDSRITVVHQHNTGCGAARNTGLNLIGGGYIVFLDSDDWIELDYVEYMLNRMHETDCDVIQCGRYISYDDHEEILKIKSEKLSGSAMLEAFLSPRVGISQTVWGKIYPAEMIRNHRFNEELKVWDDYLFNREIFFSNTDCTVLVLKEPKYHYYQDPESITHTAITEKKMRSYKIVQENIPEQIIKSSELYSWHEYFIYNLAFTYILSITKSGVAKDQYGYYINELRKAFLRFNTNSHFDIRHKMAMSFACIAPHTFYLVRKIIKGKVK